MPFSSCWNTSHVILCNARLVEQVVPPSEPNQRVEKLMLKQKLRVAGWAKCFILPTRPHSSCYFLVLWKVIASEVHLVLYCRDLWPVFMTTECQFSQHGFSPSITAIETDSPHTERVHQNCQHQSWRNQESRSHWSNKSALWTVKGILHGNISHGHIV